MPQTDVKTELDRQTDTLVALGYAALAGVTEDTLRDAAAGLRETAGRARVVRRWSSIPPPYRSRHACRSCRSAGGRAR